MNAPSTAPSYSEERRLQSLQALHILDTPPEARFDRITSLAQDLFSVPIVLVSLIDRERQWFKSRQGLDVSETARALAFCSHAVQARDMLVVPDARADGRFVDNALVTGAPFIRFYAGQPVYAPDGQAVGTLCLIDTAPRSLDDKQRQQLRDMALLAEGELQRGALDAARRHAELQLHDLNAQLEQKVAERTSSLHAINAALQCEVAQREVIEASLRQNELRTRTILDSSLSAFVSVDARGRIIDWNPAAERTFGWTRAEVAGRDLTLTIVPERYRAAHQAGFERFLKVGSGNVINQRIELPALTRSGAEISVEMTASPFPSSEGMGFGAFLHDISERRDAQRALQEKQELLDAVLDTIDVAVVSCSATGELTMVNRAMSDISDVPQTGMSARQWARNYGLYAADGKTLLQAHQLPLRRALQGELVQDAAVVLRSAARTRSFLVSGRRLTNAAGDALGAVVAMKDVTDLATSQRRAKLNEERLMAVTENLAAAIGQVDRDGNFAFLNSRAAHLFGKSAKEMIGQSVKGAHTPEEYQKVASYVETAMKGNRITFEGDTISNGSKRFFAASYVPDFDAQGEPNGFFAMAVDITARKHSEIQQRASEERLRTITDNLPVLIAYIDRDLTYRFANALYKEWHGVAPDQMIGKTALEVFGPEFVAARGTMLERCLQGETVHLDIEVRTGGLLRVVHTVCIPHVRGDEVLGAYVLSDDVTAARREQVSLHALAHTDSLTGLPNRRSYEDHLSAAINRARRSTQPLVLMYLDIDHFKSVNDTMGHANGDAVLKEFARRLKAAVRSTDTVCRLAGDEFTIIVENVRSHAECELLGQKVIAAMAAPFDLGTTLWPVTASVGIAWSGAADKPVAKLLSLDADAALYKAKGAGRNGYVIMKPAVKTSSPD